MGILKRAGDLLYTFRFLTLLVTPFDKTKAFEEGIIDADGKRIKTYKKGTEAYKEYYTPFHRLVFNVKRLMSKVPGGGSRLASYAAALYLIKENYSISEKKNLYYLTRRAVSHWYHWYLLRQSHRYSCTLSWWSPCQAIG